MNRTGKCIQVLLPALVEDKAAEKMTQDCRKSLFSIDYCLKITEDRKRYETRVAGVWNAFFDTWRGKKYDLLLVVANDMLADPQAIDYMAKYLMEHADAHVISGKVTRDMDDFKKSFGQYDYSEKLTRGKKDPACFMLKPGVIETVGRIDNWFPFEFVERDFFYRLKLAGMNWVQLDIPLWYHPPYSGTIGNPQERLHQAYRRYVQKWGGDADQEKYLHPFNNLKLDLTYCYK